MGQPPTPAQERLAAILRGLRDGAGITTYQLAEAMTVSQAAVTRIENMRRLPSHAEADAWADATGAPQAVRDEITQLVYEASTEARSWHISHRAGLAARQREMAKMDRAATEIRHFQPSVIPGLLQAESYARRVMTMADRTGKGGIDNGIRERMKRQAVLKRRGRRFIYVLTEGALRWRPGPQAMMQEQFGHLSVAAALPSVSLSVIPFDREARDVYSEGFAIFRSPDSRIVLTESYIMERFIATPGDVDTYERVFTALSESAIHGPDAIEFARAVLLG